MFEGKVNKHSEVFPSSVFSGLSLSIPLFFLTAAVVCFMVIRHLQTFDLTIYSAYFERDVFRSAQVLKGVLVPYGSELLAGGNSPGPFLYLLNAIPLWIHNHPVSVIFFTYGMLGLSLLSAHLVFSRYFDAVTSTLAILFLALNEFFFIDMKNGWNPTESFLPYAVFLGLIYHFFCSSGRLRIFLAACFLLGLLSQIHLSYMLHGISLAIGVLLLRKDIGWKGFLKGAALFLVPFTPYLIYSFFFKDPSTDSVLARSYDPTFYTFFSFSRLYQTLKIFFWHQSTSAGDMCFIGGSVFGWVVRGFLMFNVTFWLIRIYREWTGTAVFPIMETISTHRSLVVTLVLFFVPLVYFYPFVGRIGWGPGYLPFHYFFILLFPGYLLMAYVFTLSIRSLFKQARFRWVGVFQIVALVLYLMFSAQGLAGAQVANAKKLGHIFIGDAGKIISRIMNRVNIQPEDFPRKVLIDPRTISNVDKFPFLYEREYLIREGKITGNAAPVLGPHSGIFISKGNDTYFKEFQERFPLTVDWKEEVKGYDPYYVFQYTLLFHGEVKHNNLHNMYNPYLISEEGKDLLQATKKSDDISISKSIRNGEMTLTAQGRLRRSELPFRLNLRVNNRPNAESVIQARIYSPFLTGFRPETGKSMHLIKPRILIEFEKGEPVTCPLYLESTVMKGIGEFFDYVSAPFEIERKYLSPSERYQMSFLADLVINHRKNIQEGDVRLDLSSSSD